MFRPECRKLSFEAVLSLVHLRMLPIELSESAHHQGSVCLDHHSVIITGSSCLPYVLFPEAAVCTLGIKARLPVKVQQWFWAGDGQHIRRPFGIPGVLNDNTIPVLVH